MTRLRAALSITIAAAALIVASLSGYAIGTAADSTADVTVMPCSAWANQQYPTIPPHALTDACVDDRGTLHTAPTSIGETR